LDPVALPLLLPLVAPPPLVVPLRPLLRRRRLRVSLFPSPPFYLPSG